MKVLFYFLAVVSFTLWVSTMDHIQLGMTSYHYVSSLSYLNDDHPEVNSIENESKRQQFKSIDNYVFAILLLQYIVKLL